MSSKISRRQLLRGAGGVALGLPFLSLMHGDSGVARAQPIPLPKRFLVFFTPNGFNLQGWPSSGDLSGSVLAPLATHFDDVIVTRGLAMESAYLDPLGDASHYNGWVHMLTGDYGVQLGSDLGAGNISVDMFLADRLSADTRFPYSLHGVRDVDGMSWLGSGMRAGPEIDARRAFDRLFSDFDAAPDDLERVRQRRASVLDYVQGAIGRTRCRLGTEDRLRLDSHLEAIRDLERRLGVTGSGASCELPERPSSGLAYPEMGAAQMDLITMAFACDLTRVATMQWSRAVGGDVPTWIGINADHHELSHDSSSSGQSQIRQINQWYAGEFAGLLERFKNVPEGEGTMLDNTCILWVSELGLNQNEHTRRNLGIVIAGGGGGTLRGGQYLDLTGTPHQNLFVELINALSGEEHGEVSTFGNPVTCTGGIPEIRV